MDTIDLNLYFSDMAWTPQSAMRINQGGIAYCQPDWSWDTDDTRFQDHDVWCVFGGSGTLSVNQQIYRLRTGDCFILRPNGRYIGNHDPNDPLQVVFIHFDFLYGESPPPVHRRLNDVAFVRDLLMRAVNAFQDGHRPQADAWLQAALQEIHHQDTQDTDSDQTIRIDMQCNRIRSHPERTYRLDDLAEELHLSPDHFTRLFKKHRGVTPRDFILNARIDAARTLLTASAHSIARIADILGYTDVYFFSKQFKTRTGLTPTQYRKHRT